MRVLVTGACGFVGSHIVRACIGQGWTVRALVRTTSRRDNLAGLAVETTDGDVRDLQAMRRAVRDCNLVFHAAGINRLWLPDAETYYEVHGQGTTNVMRAAHEAGVERVVHVSSCASIAYRSDGRPADETTQFRGWELGYHYGQSKLLGELEALRAHALGLPVVIVNPTIVIGCCDVYLTPFGRVLLAAANGRVLVSMPGGGNWVHVDDVATGCVAAALRGRPGERYLIGSENIGLRDFWQLVACAAGVRAPAITLPTAMILPGVALLEWLMSGFGREPIGTVAATRLGSRDLFFDTSKARDELGLRPVTVARAVEDAVRWFRSKGLLRSRRERRTETTEAWTHA